VRWGVRRGHRKRHHSIRFRASFGDDFGVTIVDGPMAGILARAVVVIGADGNAAYTELVPAIDAEPNNDAGLDALGASV
jgi:thiol peroxidase